MGMSGRFKRLADHGKPRISESEIMAQGKLILRDYLYWEVEQQKKLGGNPLVTFSQVAPQSPAPVTGEGSVPATAGSPGKTVEGESAPKIEERDDIIGNLLKLDVEGCSDVSHQVIAMGKELELRYPHLFKGVACNLRLNLGSSNQLIAAFQTVSQELFRFGITWIRIVALFAITKSLFLECAIEGNYQHSIHLVDAFLRVVRRRLSEWIIANGGWIGLAYYVEKNQESGLVVWLYSMLGLSIGVTFTWLIPWAWRTLPLVQ